MPVRQLYAPLLMGCSRLLPGSSSGAVRWVAVGTAGGVVRRRRGVEVRRSGGIGLVASAVSARGSRAESWCGWLTRPLKGTEELIARRIAARHEHFILAPNSRRWRDRNQTKIQSLSLSSRGRTRS